MSEQRLIAHHSFLIPANKYIVDFDITTSVPFPAFIELSLYLLDTLKTISPHELQSFFGIDENERDSLIQQILSTDLAFTNDNGDLELTSKIEESRQPDGSIQLAKYENYSASFFVDLVTKHIQPRSLNYDKIGFFELIPEVYSRDLCAEDIFRDDFNRFKSCNTNRNIKESRVSLYRINDCTFSGLVDFPVSVDVFSELQPNGQLQIGTSLSGFSESDIDLVMNSGILRYINEELNNYSECSDSLSPKDYCFNVQDPVLLDFFSDSGIFDIEKYLIAREKRKTGYNSQKTTGLLGAIYLPQNKGKLVEWVRKVSHIQPILWMPSSSAFWAASAHTKVFYEELYELLHKKGGFLSLVLPQKTKSEIHKLEQRFTGFVDTIQCFPASNPLDEMEIMIVPGSPCWAMVQYHARISPEYNLRNIRIPIGYVTYDSERVKHLWSFLLKRINFNGESTIEPFGRKFKPDSRVLDCFTHSQNWHKEESDIENS